MNKTLLTTVLSATLASGVASAGTKEVIETKPSSPCGDWCESLKTVGQIYKGDGVVNEFAIFGRFHYNVANTSGDIDGPFDQDFSENFTEIRRLRIGAKAKFFNRLLAYANMDLEDGGPNDNQLGYGGMFEAYLKYDTGAILGFDNTSVQYGRVEYKFGQENHTSSKKIKTVERSVLTNFFYQAALPTSFLLNAEKGDWSGSLGILSTDYSEDFASWNAGIALYATTEFKAGPGEVLLDATYVDVNGDEDDIFGYEWALSAAYTLPVGAWEVVFNAMYGEIEDGDAAYGFYVMPSIYLIEDKLEFVARYTYMAADEDIIPASRYATRAAAEEIGVSNGEIVGEEYQSIYAGLNWYFCGHNSKLQGGVEYETLDNDSFDTDGDAVTFWLGYRMYF